MRGVCASTRGRRRHRAAGSWPQGQAGPPLKFLLDENADQRLVPDLIALGHDVSTIAVEHPGSIEDSEVLRIANRERRILITNDTDFGDLIFQQSQPHAGVILSRLSSTAIDAKRQRLLGVLARFPSGISDFVVVTDDRMRIRRSR